MPLHKTMTMMRQAANLIMVAGIPLVIGLRQKLRRFVIIVEILRVDVGELVVADRNGAVLAVADLTGAVDMIVVINSICDED
jgi:hypothetical protein